MASQALDNIKGTDEYRANKWPKQMEHVRHPLISQISSVSVNDLRHDVAHVARYCMRRRETEVKKKSGMGETRGRLNLRLVFEIRPIGG